MYGIIVQARTGSSRLPGKIHKKVLGKTLLEHQVDRLRRSKKADKLVIATTVRGDDDKTVGLCRKIGADYSRGPIDDLVGRFLKAAHEHGITTIVRVCSDCPLIDPQVVDDLIEMHEKTGAEYISAAHNNGWPYGLGAWLITTPCLAKLNGLDLTPFQREHIVPFLNEHPEIFRTALLKAPYEINRNDYFLAVDYPEDLKLIKHILGQLYREDKDFTVRDILNYLDENPHISRINRRLHKGYAN